jgi:hypothetical protein
MGRNRASVDGCVGEKAFAHLVSSRLVLCVCDSAWYVSKQPGVYENAKSDVDITATSFT